MMPSMPGYPSCVAAKMMAVSTLEAAWGGLVCGARGGRMPCSRLHRVLWLACAIGLAMGARDGRTRGGHAGTADHLLYFTFYLVGGARWGGVGLLLSALL